MYHEVTCHSNDNCDTDSMKLTLDVVIHHAVTFYSDDIWQKLTDFEVACPLESTRSVKAAVLHDISIAVRLCFVFLFRCS